MRRMTCPITAASIVVVAITMISGMAEASLPPAASPLGRPAASACGRWSIVPTPRIPGSTQHLAGVAAISGSDVWAVGQAENVTEGEFPLAEHWDGAAWTRVSLPSSGSGRDDALTDVAALSADDVWAVGSSSNGSTNPRPLAMHWDGAAWKIDSPAGTSGEFRAVTAVPGASQIWAVGNDGPKTLVARHTSRGWRVSSSPSPGSISNQLVQVSSSGRADAWATGIRHDADGFHPLTLHRDGSTWTVAPDPGTGGVIAAIGSSDALSAGDDFERWDGAAWSDLGPTGGFPYGITSTATDGWTAGFQGPSDFYSTYTAHWDGSGWSVVPSPNVPGEQASLLYDVTALPGSSSAWAVGTSYHRNAHARAIETVLIESFC